MQHATSYFLQLRGFLQLIPVFQELLSHRKPDHPEALGTCSSSLQQALQPIRQDATYSFLIQVSEHGVMECKPGSVSLQTR